jgi:hydrogenase/urease accessory protein HupE
MIRPVVLLGLLLAALFAAPLAHADELRPGYLSLTETAPGEWTMVWKVPMTGAFTPQTRPELPASCQIVGNPERRVSDRNAITTTAVRCRGAMSGQRIGLAGFAASQSDVLARIEPRGRAALALRLTPAQPWAEIPALPDRWQVARTYFVIGIDHIVFGYDHLLFVVALVLLLNGFWTIAKAVTAFTIAHSITLIGTTLGLVGLPQRPVEAVIALSILFLAIEIVKQRPGEPRLSERLPWLVAFGFGLLHGFGFAGALSEIGLPENDVPTALLTFNLGVEAGQLAVVAVTMALIALTRRMAPRALPPAIRTMAYAIGSLSSFWLIQRLV